MEVKSSYVWMQMSNGKTKDQKLKNLRYLWDWMISQELDTKATHHLHTLESTPPEKIDFLLGTEEVINNVIAVGMVPLSTARSIGDHRAQYVDMNVKNF